MLATTSPRHMKRRSSAPPPLPQALLSDAVAAGAAGEIFVPHHDSPMRDRRGVSLTLPVAVAAEAQGAAGEIFVPHYDTTVGARRSVSLTLPDVGPMNGAAGEIFVPHQDTAMRDRRRVSLSLGDGIVSSTGGGAAGEIFVPHHDTAMRDRRRVSLTLTEVASSSNGGGAAGEIFVPHHDTPMQKRRSLTGLSLGPDAVRDSDGAAGEMFQLNTTSSSGAPSPAGSSASHTSSANTTPLSQRRLGPRSGNLTLPDGVAQQAQRLGGAVGEMMIPAKSNSDLSRRRGSDLTLPNGIAGASGDGDGAAGEMMVVNPNGPLGHSSPDRSTAASFGTPNFERNAAPGRDKANEALNEFNSRPLDARVSQLTAALMREYVAKHAATSRPLRDAFEDAFPRDESTVTRRSVMCAALGLAEGNRDDVSSILERLVRTILESSTADPVARFQRNVESRLSSGPSSLFNSNARFLGDDGGNNNNNNNGGSTDDALAGIDSTAFNDNPLAEKSVCFNMTDDGSGVAINGLNVDDKTSVALFRLKNLAELDISNADVIGKGAGGRVLRATHTTTGEKFAVKEISISNEDSIKQIQSEVSIMWGTSNRHKDHVPSPYLVNCEGIFYQGGTLLIAMELMDGSLKDALDVHGPFNEQQIKAMTFQLLHGLLYMHYEKKQLHRDIKPHNILYNRDGWVKLSDFGIASDKMMATSTTTFCGTLIYMSPNRAEGANYSYEGDIWSLGITLYQLASGKLPIGNSIFEVMQLRTNPPKLPMAPPMTTPPSVRRPYSPAFNAFMDRCLDPNAASGSVSVRDLLRLEWMQDMTLAKSQRIVQEVCKEIMTRTQRNEAGLKPVGLGKRDDLFATLDEALA